MSEPSTMFVPGGVATTTTPVAYVIPMDHARFILKGQYNNPLQRRHEMPLPPHRFILHEVSGAKVAPVYGEESHADGVSWILYDDDNRVNTPNSEWLLAWQPLLDQGSGKPRAPLALFTTEVFIDLEKNDWVAPSDVARIEARRLLRVSLWTSAFKARVGGFVDAPPKTNFAKTGKLRQSKGELRGYRKKWVVQIDHGLHRSWVRLYYYNPVAKARKPVPHGLTLSAFGEDKLNMHIFRREEPERVGAATSLDDSGTFYLLHDRATGDTADLHYYFSTGPRGTTDKCIIDYSVPEPAPGARDERLKIVSTDPNPVPTARYVLPTEWHSYGTLAWFTDHWKGYGDRKPFEEQRAAATSKDRPLLFHLDDAVLATTPTTLAPIGKDQRVAFFDHLMHLRDCDPVKPHVWLEPLKRNYLRGEMAVYVDEEGIESVTRLAYMDGVFYDLRDKRMQASDASQLGVAPCIGARAFVANDLDEWHRRVAYVNGDPATPSTRETEGTWCSAFHLIDVSYVKQAFPSTLSATQIELINMGLVHLLVFVPLTIDPATGTQAERDAFLPMLTNASERWDQEHPAHPSKPQSTEKPSTLALVPKAGAVEGKKLVRVRHYFGEVPATFTRAMKISLFRPPYRNGRGWTDAANGKMELLLGDIGMRAGGTGEDGQDAATTRFTFAHELGHAMGLPDEYVETIEGGFRSWGQYAIDGADARPFVNDAVGMMVTDNKPRLRNYWNYANRVSTESQFRAMVGNQDYVACNAWQDVVPLMYELPFVGPLATGFSGEAGKTPYFPVHPGFLLGRNVGAALYRLGQDEGAIQRMFKGPGGIGAVLPPGKRYDGLLLVRIRFMFDFDKGLDVSSQRIPRYRRILDLFTETDIQKAGYVVYGNQFAIEVEPATTNPPTEHPYLRRIALAFVPEFDYRARWRDMSKLPPVGDVNIKVVAQRSDPHPLLSPPVSGELELTSAELDLSILRFALGLPTYDEDPKTQARTLKKTIAAADLQFIGDIVNVVLGTPSPTRRVVRNP